MFDRRLKFLLLAAIMTLAGNSLDSKDIERITKEAITAADVDRIYEQIKAEMKLEPKSILSVSKSQFVVSLVLIQDENQP